MNPVNNTPLENMEYNGNKIKQRVWTNINEMLRNWLCLVVGNVGTGKSYSGLRIGELFDKKFSVDNVVFNRDDFMRCVKELPSGSFIIADEIGSWMGARDFLSETNKLLSYVIQTFRFKRLGVIWTLPLKQQADLNIRSMCDATVETMAVLKEDKLCLAKLKMTETNAMSGNVYHKFPIVRRLDGQKVTITEAYFRCPSKKLIDAYEEKKKEHMDKFYDKIIDGFKTEDGMLEAKRKKFVGSGKDENEKKYTCPSCNHWEWSAKVRKRCGYCGAYGIVESD